MSNVEYSSRLDLLKPENLTRFLSEALGQIREVINGRLDWKNFRGVDVLVDFPSAGAEVLVPLSLKYTPTGYLILRSSGPFVVYDGVTPWTSNTIALRASASGRARIFIF